jgi:hypothetical protein
MAMLFLLIIQSLTYTQLKSAEASRSIVCPRRSKPTISIPPRTRRGWNLLPTDTPTSGSPDMCYR